jgi:hypothetical protein
MKPWIAIVAVMLLGLTGVVRGADSTYFDATNSIIDPTDPVGTTWHELYPSFCQSPYTITGWADNGDGELSHCDVIAMENPDGVTECHHVLIVTYTLELTQLEPPSTDPHYMDLTDDGGKDPLADPVETLWHEVYPEYCREHVIVEWIDNESGELDFCDQIVCGDGAVYHVEGVHTDMVTEPEDDCPTDLSTWSRIKVLYR